MEAELSLGACALQCRHELTTKNPAQDLDGKKEGGAGPDPASVARGQTTGGKYAMDMGMVLELLIPGVEYAEEADLGAQMLGIASDFEEGFSAGAEQQVIDDLLVLQGQWRQFPWKSENNMHVGSG